MIDWRQVMLQLRSTNLTYGQISLSTNVPRGTLRALAYRGNQPVYTNGENIVMYWCKRMNKSRDELPKVVATASTICVEHDNNDAETSSLRACGSQSPTG